MPAPRQVPACLHPTHARLQQHGCLAAPQQGPNAHRHGQGGHINVLRCLQVALPFGVTLLAPAWWDEWLWGVGAQMAGAVKLGCGPVGHGVAAPVRVRL